MLDGHNACCGNSINYPTTCIKGAVVAVLVGACDADHGGRNVQVGLGQWIQHGCGRNTNVRPVLVHFRKIAGPRHYQECTSVVMFRALHPISQGEELFMNLAPCSTQSTHPPSWVECNNSDELWSGLVEVLQKCELHAFSSMYSMHWYTAAARIVESVPEIDTITEYTVTAEACQQAFGIIDDTFFNRKMALLLQEKGAPIEVFKARGKQEVFIMAFTHAHDIPLPSSIMSKNGSPLRDSLTYPVNTIFVNQSGLEDLCIADGLAVWLFDGVRVKSSSAVLLHLIAHELVHAFLNSCEGPACTEHMRTPSTITIWSSCALPGRSLGIP